MSILKFKIANFYYTALTDSLSMKFRSTSCTSIIVQI